MTNLYIRVGRKDETMTTDNNVKLHNGTEEPEHLVKSVVYALRIMLDKGLAVPVLELVKKCRDDNHVFFGSSRGPLQKHGLVEPDGSVHGSVRNIVLNSFEGEDLSMQLVNPIMEREVR